MATLPDPHFTDAIPPAEIARRVERIGVAKAHAPVLSLLVLSLLGGAFISLGALFFTVISTGSELGFGPTRLLGGLGFSLGLILVVLAGAELFTGNNLIAMAWASGLIGLREVARNWVIVYIGNAIGCLATALLVRWTGVASLSDGAIGQTAMRLAEAKVNLSMIEAFTRGILCNALVCLAVWLAIGARGAADKILAIIFPVTAFVAIGFEHSIANFFLLPWAILLAPDGAIAFSSTLRSLVVVTAGNVVGGTLLVAGVYWLAYRRAPRGV